MSFLPRGPVGAIDRQVVAKAAHWVACMQSGEASEAQRLACDAWRRADPAHELAWQRMAMVCDDLRERLAPISPALARQALAARPEASRRTMLKALAGLGVVSGGAWLTARHAPWTIVTADYRTGAGERRTIVLSDGTQVTLNTGTAIDVRFDSVQRRLLLHSGEIQVTTGKDAAGRPLHVATRFGRIVPLGTRFIVRDVQNGLGDEDRPMSVAVHEGAVRIVAANGATLGTLNTGESAAVGRDVLGPPEPVSDQASAWLDGMLVAEHMPLPDFIAEVGRYRRGVVQCDPSLAHLRVSGAFALDDTEAVLGLLQATFPVRVQHLTRYWVRVRGA